MKFHFTNLTSAQELIVKELSPLLSYTVSADGIPVEVTQNKTGLTVEHKDGKVLLSYHKLPELCRGLTMLSYGQDKPYCEIPAHDDLCTMVDCSRNAVMNIPSAKRMLRYMALMGFTSLMLYTEDTYKMPEYPYFGHLRGGYSKEELREIDDYAAIFGIEVIPCMQVLAHLEGSLRWHEFAPITDTGNILLVGDERVYAFIECMIKTQRECFPNCHRIHIGMDEAWLLGAGQYLVKNGHRPRHEILREHLQRVVKICAKYDFKPMMWSDMFFQNAFGKYYVEEGEIPTEVIAQVPEEVTLVYWDYYTQPHKEKMFRHMLHCHQQFGKPYVFAGGAWKWGSNAPFNHFSLYVNDLHLRVSREEKVPMVIATCWGDNGSDSSHFSIMPVLQQYAEYAYAKGEDRAWVAKRFEETYQIPFEDFLLLDAPNVVTGIDPKLHPYYMAKTMTYNDPLGGWADAFVPNAKSEEFVQMQKNLERVQPNAFSYLFDISMALCKLLEHKATLSIDLRKAYLDGDRAQMARIANERIPAALEAAENYLDTFRRGWFIDNNTYGIDVIEIRMGGLKERLKSTARIIGEYLDGTLDRIDQLEQPVLPQSKYVSVWSKICTANIM